MDKEKDIEEMARVLEFCAHKDCESCRKQGNYRCSAFNKATDLQKAGYGNIEQAVREFAEKLKEKVPFGIISGSSVWEAIDELVKEITGSDV